MSHEHFTSPDSLDTVDVKWDNISDGNIENQIKNQAKEYIEFQQNNWLEWDQLQCLIDDISWLLQQQDIDRLNLNDKFNHLKKNICWESFSENQKIKTDFITQYSLKYNNVQSDIVTFLDGAFSNTLKTDLVDFNINKFDRKDEIEGFSEYELQQYTQVLDKAMQQMNILWSFDEFSKKTREIWEEPSFLSWKWDIALANTLDLQEYIFWEWEKHLTNNLHSYTEEELFSMKEQSFDITDSEKMKNFVTLLWLELWNWIEDILKFIGNIPAGIVLLPRYITNRIELSDSSIDSVDEVNAQMENDMLLKENPALMLCELLWEKWIQMIKKLWEMFVSWKNGDIASVLVMIAGLLAWWAGLAKVWSNLARKSAVKNARSAWRKNRTTQWREFRNNFKTLSGTADNIYQSASKVDDLIWGAALGHLTWSFSNNQVLKSENVWDSRNIENQNQLNQEVHSKVNHIETTINFELSNQKQLFDLEDNTKMNVILWDSWEIVIHKSNGKYYIYSEWPNQKDKNLANKLHWEWVNIIHKDAAHIIELGESFDLWKKVRNFNIWWETVSRNHLTINNVNGKIEIEDHSTNGTIIKNYKEKSLNYDLHNQSELYQLNSHEPIQLKLWEHWLIDIKKDDRWNYFAFRNNKFIRIDEWIPLKIWRNSNLDLWFNDISTNHLTIEYTGWWLRITDHSTNGTQVLQHNNKVNKERVNIWREVSDKQAQKEQHQIYLQEKASSLNIWDEVYIKRSSWTLEKWWTIEEIKDGQYILESPYINWNWSKEYLTRNSKLEEIYTVQEIERPKSWDASWDEVSEMKKRSFEHIEHNSTLSKESYNILFNWDVLKQQNVGNCYLISALNSLRKSPHYEAIIRLSIQKVNGGYNIKIPLWSKNWQVIFVNLDDIQPQKNINLGKRDNSGKVDNREYLHPIDWPEWLKLIEAAYWKMITSQQWKQWEILNRLYMEGWYWEQSLMKLLGSNTLARNNITWEWLFNNKWYLKNLASKWDKIINQVENFLDNFHPWKDIATVNTMRSQQWHDSKYFIDGIELYNSHAYSITNVDKFNQIVHVTNPWNAHEVIPLTYNQFMRAFSDTSSVEIRADNFLK